jgi:hypothetical protein
MANYSRRKIISAVALCRDHDKTINERGAAFEDLSRYALEKIPGIQTVPNVYNPFHSEEVDIAVSNGRRLHGLETFPPHFLVECKNWSEKVGASDIDSLVAKLDERGLDLGVLVTALGITGEPSPVTAAHHKVSLALARGYRVVVVTLADIEILALSSDFSDLLNRRLLGLLAAGTVVLN